MAREHKSLQFVAKGDRVTRVLTLEDEPTYIATIARERRDGQMTFTEATEPENYSVTFGRGGERYIVPRVDVLDIIEAHIYEQASMTQRKLRAHLLIDNYTSDKLVKSQGATARKFIELFLTDTRLMDLLK